MSKIRRNQKIVRNRLRQALRLQMRKTNIHSNGRVSDPEKHSLGRGRLVGFSRQMAKGEWGYLTTAGDLRAISKLRQKER